MNKKYILVGVVFLAMAVVGIKTFLIANSPVIVPVPGGPGSIPETAELYNYIRSDLPLENGEEEIVKRALAIQELSRFEDKDIAINVLEDLEKNQKEPFLADRLRRAILALRFNKPLDNYNQKELRKLLFESKRSM